MAEQRDNNRSPRPPAPRGGAWLGAAPKLGAQQKVADTEAHAQEVRDVLGGRNIVEHDAAVRERQLAAFHSPDMLVVRSWMSRRAIEGPVPAAALVAFPRLWNTARGRYCRFVAPGAGKYGLVRARPTF